MALLDCFACWPFRMASRDSPFGYRFRQGSLIALSISRFRRPPHWPIAQPLPDIISETIPPIRKYAS